MIINTAEFYCCVNFWIVKCKHLLHIFWHFSLFPINLKRFKSHDLARRPNGSVVTKREMKNVNGIHCSRQHFSGKDLNIHGRLCLRRRLERNLISISSALSVPKSLRSDDADKIRPRNYRWLMRSLADWLLSIKLSMLLFLMITHCPQLVVL